MFDTSSLKGLSPSLNGLSPNFVSDEFITR